MKDEKLAVISVTIIALISMVLIPNESKDIVNIAVGGIIGYMSKG